MLKYIFYLSIHIFIFLFIINKYYEYIINFLLIPINKQNNFKILDYSIYKELEDLHFNYKNDNNLYPIFEINFSIENITYIYYYLIIIYIIIYITPIILLQSFLFAKSSLFKHEKYKYLRILLIYLFIFVFVLYINSNFFIYFFLNFLFNTYQQINLYIFDLNFNLYEYLTTYLFILLINICWLVYIYILMFYNLYNIKTLIVSVFILVLLLPFSIFIYAVEIVYLTISYLIIKYIYLIIYYNKRIPSEYK